MEKWRLFEDNCVNYLNKTYGNNTVNFIGTGKSNSTTSDIKVLDYEKNLFNIESKMPEAQSGQFVLLDIGGEFIFSDKNKSIENEFTDLIINYINKNYDVFKNVSTKSLPIDLPIDIFESWIKNHYKSRNVKYVITSDKNNNYILFPIDKYGEYFRITGNFRIKTSGSGDLPKKYEYEVQALFQENFSSCSIVREGKKAYIFTEANLPDKTKLQGNDCRFQFNKEEDRYLVRKLSNTNNPNVIFSIKLEKHQCQDDLKMFRKEFE